MGIERVVAWICGLEHVRETIPYPRMLYRLYPMKVGLISLGCPKNLVDSEVMLGLAREAGHELTANAAEADVLVVNTCAFIDSAEAGVGRRHPRDGRAARRTATCRRLIVTGCLAERYRDELRAEIPEIDAVLGTGEVPRIVDAIGGSAAPRGGARP